MKVNIYPDKLKFVSLSHEQLRNVYNLGSELSYDRQREYLFVKGSKDELFSLLYKLSKLYDIDLI